MQFPHKSRIIAPKPDIFRIFYHTQKIEKNEPAHVIPNNVKNALNFIFFFIFALPRFKRSQNALFMRFWNAPSKMRLQGALNALSDASYKTRVKGAFNPG